jgi:hypothetical protein
MAIISRYEVQIFSLPYIFLAPHFKPNLEIWRFLPFFFSPCFKRPPKSLHFHVGMGWTGGFRGAFFLEEFLFIAKVVIMLTKI